MPTPKKANNLHKLMSTKSQATNEPGNVAPGRPKFPRDLAQAEKQVFKELCALLAERKHLTSADAELCRLFAVTKVRDMRALKHLAIEGDVILVEVTDSHGRVRSTPKKNPYLDIAFVCEKNMVSLLDRLGFTCVSRSKIKPTEDLQPAVVDPMEASFLNRPRTTFAAPPYVDSPVPPITLPPDTNFDWETATNFEG
jgi:P27 family predicted phage terminase small subunit